MADEFDRFMGSYDVDDNEIIFYELDGEKSGELMSVRIFVNPSSIPQKEGKTNVSLLITGEDGTLIYLDSVYDYKNDKDTPRNIVKELSSIIKQTFKRN